MKTASIKESRLDENPPIFDAAVPVALQEAAVVNVNSLIAGAIRQNEHAAGSVILRMDELPELSGNPVQLREAFELLLRFMLAQQAQAGKIYCYVKGVPLGLTVLDDENSYSAYCVEIHSNAQEREATPCRHLLVQAEAWFANNRIAFEYRRAPAGGMQFLLTVFGSTLVDGKSR